MTDGRDLVTALSDRIILIRHALPAVDADVDSREWGLAPGAAAEAERLAVVLPNDIGETIWTSSERKAVETADAIARVRGLHVEIDDRFGEVRRPWTAGDYRAEALRYLGGDVPDGWEEPSVVVERFGAGVNDGASLVIDHGIALTLFLASVTEIDVRSFWSALTFPDAWSLSTTAREVVRLGPRQT